MVRFRLSTVLRARQVQEDVLKGNVARAHRAARTAQERAQQRADKLHSTELLSGGNARAVVAALAARHALAAGLAAAHHAVAEAHEQVDQQKEDLAQAAKRRRAVERLGERHAAAVKASAESTEQRALDEIASNTVTRRGDSPL